MINKREKILVKTIYSCPVEGIVPKEVSHTHTFTLVVYGDFVTIVVLNEGYMCEKPERYVVQTTKQEIIDLFKNEELLIGDAGNLVDDFPDEFIQSIVIQYYKINNRAGIH